MGNSFRRNSKFALGRFVLIVAFFLTPWIGASVFLWPSAVSAQGAGKGILHRHDPLVRAAIEIKNRHMGNLMRIPDVVGSGVGIGSDGLPAIKVFTARHGVTGIPESLESFPVDVEVTGMVVALGACPAGDCGRPAPIGVSTGHPAITAGTIGARVKDQNGNVYALSNNHVYANINNAKIGDSALQPGSFDGGTDPADKIGELYAFQPINFSVFGSNTIDAAIANSTPDDLGFATLPDGYGAPSSQIIAASIGLPVQKYGRTTQLTRGEVSDINVTISVCYANCSSRFFAQLAWFEDQIGIASTDAGSFSAGGDSGSLIVTDDGNNNPVGLLFAGSDTKTFANRIDLVLNHFGVMIDDGQGTPPLPLVAPSNLTSTAVSSSQINLTWKDNASNENGFEIERCTGSGCTSFAHIASVASNVTTYSNTGLLASTPYTYRVRAYNAGGDSEYSNQASATTLAAPTLPATPSNLTATAVSRSQINVAWKDNADNETGFRIERCRGSSCTNFAAIATVGQNATSYQNRGLSRATTYRYRVRAYNAAGNSAYSNIVSATTRR